MKCVRPLVIDGRRVRCGRCMPCRITRTSEWSVRLLHETTVWSDCVFVTLTYRDEELPSDLSVDPRALQLAIKRVRKSSDKRFKYFAVGEYGDISGRPHYHLVVFGHSLSDEILWSEGWPYGHVHCGSVTPASIRYVCGYVQKKLYGLAADKVYGEREAPFLRCSKRLGFDYMKKHWDSIESDGFVTVRGKKIGVPKYYRKHLSEEFAERSEAQAEEREHERFEFFIQRTNNVVRAAEMGRRRDQQTLEELRTVAERSQREREDKGRFV